jgi:hypothetical protein
MREVQRYLPYPEDEAGSLSLFLGKSWEVLPQRGQAFAAWLGRGH